ncbi:hypothetical protein JW823_06050, partial [bacterium]|nr:hypothetical protein [candidate division CSSED10-310 bacterium]
MRQHFLEWMMCLGIGVFASAVSAATIRVPADKPTIQDAIDAAVYGDTVLIADGVYTGDGNRDLVISGKTIIVQSENGPLACIIDCQGSESSHHFGIQAGGNSIVQGLTIRNGYDYYGAAIRFADGSPVIADCVIVKNFSVKEHQYSHGTIISPSAGIPWCPQIINCMISENETEDGYLLGGGFFYYPILINCSLLNNTGEIMKYPESLSRVTMSNCIFWGNSPPSLNVGSNGYGNPLYHVVSYSDVETGYPGDGNIDKDPLILSRDPAGAKLSPFSPCIDAGTAEDAPETDLYGNPRPSGNGIDMGAHEFTWPSETRSFIGMPSHRFRSGDSAFCRICLWNTGDYDLADARLFVVLDLMG